MAEVTAELLDAMTRAIVEEVDPEQVVLFGSRARGDAHADSDVDFLVVESEPFGEGHSRWDEMQRLRGVLQHFPVSKDILVCSTDETAKWAGATNHIIARCLREGKVVYQRP